MPDFDLKDHIRTVPDFPEPGIMYRDITTLLANPDALQNAVTAEFDDAEAASSAKRLEEVIASFNAGLSDALDDVMNTEHGSQRTELCKTAGRVTSDYLDFVFGSPMIQHVQSNPFFAIDLEATLAQPLQLIEIELAKDGT